MAVDPISIRQAANTPWEPTTDASASLKSDGNLRRILDHGYVRLVKSSGGDLDVVRAARVSYNAEWRAGENSGSDARLIRYLMRNGHTSPFEHVTFTFEVKAPIFVLRQWHRHRTWSYNEVSARYTELPEEFYIPEINKIGVQSKDNKQGREFIDESKLDEPLWLGEDGFIADKLRVNSEKLMQEYKYLLKYTSCPREIARIILPLNTYSHMFATVDLHNLLKFIKERTSPGAQYEIKVYAEAMLDLIQPIVPVSIGALLESNSSGK